MRFTLGILVMVCSTAIADPTPLVTARRSIPVTRQLKPNPKAPKALKTPKLTSESYRVRISPMPYRSGF